MPSPCTVTALISNVANQPVQGSFVRLILRNFKGFVPRVLGTDVIVETQVDLIPDVNGNISSPIWGNDNIDPANTFYTAEWWSGGRITSQANFFIIGASFNLNTAAILNPPNPPSTIATPLLLETNGVRNGSQIQFNAVAGTGMTITDDGHGNVTFASSGGGGAVSSVFGRTGVVVAQAGDYTAAQVTNAQDNSVSHAAHTFLGAPSGGSGTPSFRTLISSDIPDLSATYQLVSAKDAANGYAGLDGGSLLKPAEFPALTGDVTSSVGTVATTVVKLQGRSLAATAPSNGQVIAWNNGNNDWEPTSVSSLGANASQIQSVNVNSAAPLDGDVLNYSVTQNDYEMVMRPDWLTFPVGSTASPQAINNNFPFTGLSFTTAVGQTTANVAGTATELPGIKLTSGSTAGNSAGWLIGVNAATFLAEFGVLRRFRFRVQLAQTTNTRMWIGLANGSSVATFQNNAPAVALVAFRYSTAAGDTKWQVVASNGTTQTTTATTVAPDTNIHDFDLVYDTTQVKFYIDRVLVGTVSTNLPTNTTNQGPILVLDNAGTANAQSFTWYLAKGTIDFAKL